MIKIRSRADFLGFNLVFYMLAIAIITFFLSKYGNFNLPILIIGASGLLVAYCSCIQHTSKSSDIQFAKNNLVHKVFNVIGIISLVVLACTSFAILIAGSSQASPEFKPQVYWNYSISICISLLCYFFLWTKYKVGELAIVQVGDQKINEGEIFFMHALLCASPYVFKKYRTLTRWDVPFDCKDLSFIANVNTHFYLDIDMTTTQDLVTFSRSIKTYEERLLYRIQQDASLVTFKEFIASDLSFAERMGPATLTCNDEIVFVFKLPQPSLVG